MTEIYRADNNTIIDFFNNQEDEEWDDDTFQKNVDCKIIDIFKRNNKELYNKFNNENDLLNFIKEEYNDELLDESILEFISLKLKDINLFYSLGEKIFSIEMFSNWVFDILQELTNNYEKKYVIDYVEIGYNKKRIIYNPFREINKEKKEEIKISDELKEILDKHIELENCFKKNVNVKQILHSKPILINTVLQSKINKLKNKIKNNSLNKDISIKIKGKTYNFKSNKNITPSHNKPKINNYSNNNDFKKKYYSKYNKITNEDINMKKLEIEEKERNNKLFWDNYNKKVLESKNKLNNIFKNDPVFEINKELFNNKYENKSLSDIYKNIISEIDVLEREYNNFRIIETYYNKLKENTNINSVFKNSNNKIHKLFTDYENNRINEYKVLLEIGNLVTNDKLSNQEKKEINSINQNSRPARILKESQRIYFLEEFVNIKNIALSGISNWLRDTSDDNFNMLLTLFTT